MIETYAEYGAIGIIVVLFVGMIHFLKSTLFSKLKEIEDKRNQKGYNDNY